MHIILGLLGTIVTILILVNRLSDAGIDIGWLNPFTWHRRRSWRKKYEGNPVFSLERPMEVAAILATSVAKIDGEISREDKSELLQFFQQEFSISEQSASELLMSSIYLFGDGEDAIAKPERVMQRAQDTFTEEQAKSTIALLNGVKDTGSVNLSEKENYIGKVERSFASQFGSSGKW